LIADVIKLRCKQGLQSWENATWIHCANLKSGLATLAWPKVSMLLILILVTVVFSEWITAKVRQKLI
jgi:hypothetical protein